MSSSSVRRTSLAHPRAVRLLVGAAAISFVGDEAAAIALVVSTHDSTRSGAAVAALLFAALLPLVVLGPVAGWLVDRVETVRLISVTALGQALVASALAFTGGFAARLALLLLIGAGTAIVQPALYALTPLAAGPDRGRDVVTYLSVASRAGSVAGPMVGALLLAVGGLRGALLADAATFLALAAGFRLLGLRREPEPTAEEAADEVGTGHAALAGLATLRRDPVLRAVIGSLAGAIVFVGICYVAEVFYAKDVLSAGNTGLALLTGGYSLGMVIGCYGVKRISVDRLPGLCAGVPAMIGCAFLVAAAAPVMPVAVCCFVVAGCGCGVGLTGMRALILERVPEALLGRVYAAESAIGTAGELGSLLLAGAVVTLVGPRTALAIAGAGAVVPGIVALVLLTSARWPGRAVSLTVARPVPAALDLQSPRSADALT